VAVVLIFKSGYCVLAFEVLRFELAVSQFSPLECIYSSGVARI